jgi:hypothetical protein
LIGTWSLQDFLLGGEVVPLERQRRRVMNVVTAGKGEVDLGPILLFEKKFWRKY